jgi:HAMP domain-containing protein
MAGPGRSIRLRLQIWYAAVLVAVIGGFAGLVYYQARGQRMRAIDARLETAATYLEATVRGWPPHEVEGMMPPRGPRERGFEDRERFDNRPRRPEGEPRRPPSPRPGRPPGDDRPPPADFGPRPDGPPPMPPADRLRLDGPPDERRLLRIELPGSLLDAPDEREQPYFVIWRGGGNVLAASSDAQGQSAALIGPQSVRAALRSGRPPGFRWRDGDCREMLLEGPRGTLILVGKPAGRELAELEAFAWQLAAGGMAVLAIGLASGWLTSRSITRPIAAISRTASAISASNLSRRIETAGIDEELVGLATILNEMFARLEAAFERQSRFTSDASHEMRTPPRSWPCRRPARPRNIARRWRHVLRRLRG